MGARVTVEGTAAPGATVLLSGGCAVQGCRALARADDEGTWEGSVRVEAPVGRPSATIEARDPGGGDPAAVKVRLRVPDLPEPEAEAAPREPRARVAPSGPAPRRLVMIGDSLAEGTEPILPGLLDDWTVTQDALKGRFLSEGMRILESISLGAERVVLAFSLFTNDDPRNVDALEAAVRESVERAGPGGCAVWATISRPPYGGVSYRAANARLEALAYEPGLAGRLLVVPWAQAVASNPSWMSADRVHATPEGYGARARMYADAARACGG